MKYDWQDKKITVITGAGFSHASGVPTFRGGEDSLWNNYSPTELATPQAFARDPKLVWEWYKWRIGIVLETQPNAAHNVLADLEQKGVNISIITQNVDNLHERAGSQNVIHVHGEILKARCSNCSNKVLWTEKILKEHQNIPQCELCKSNYRPDVVWFGETLDGSIIQTCLKILNQSDLLIVAGTSGVVYPIADFPFQAKRNNPAIEIFEFNIERTPISSVATKFIHGPVEKTLNQFFNNNE
jgi:NAD-dependent deacetylase